MAEVLYDHRADALTCYDHPNAYCCVCGAHEVGGHRSHLADVLAALLARVRRESEAERDDVASRLSELLCDLTGGRMSKTGYSVATMRQAIEEEFDRDAVEREADGLRAAVASLAGSWEAEATAGRTGNGHPLLVQTYDGHARDLRDLLDGATE